MTLINHSFGTPSFYAQARTRKFTARVACGPRGGQGESSLLDSAVYAAFDRHEAGGESIVIV